MMIMLSIDSWIRTLAIVLMDVDCGDYNACTADSFNDTTVCVNTEIVCMTVPCHETSCDIENGYEYALIVCDNEIITLLNLVMMMLAHVYIPALIVTITIYVLLIPVKMGNVRMLK